MSREPTPNLVILISGSGSNLQAFIDAVANGTLNANIAAVISNRPAVFGLQRAQQAGIATATIDHTTFPNRQSFDLALADCIDEFTPDAVILAGFMRILTPEFIRRYQGVMLNIHPSLLPKYPGLHTHQRAIDAGDKESGATVHFVTEQLDGGPPALQARMPIKITDSADDLAARVLIFEHKIYPLAVQWLCDGRLRMLAGKALLDGQVLPNSGFDFNQLN